MNKKTRRMTEGAMMAAMIAVFLLINRQLGGMLNVYMTWIIPIPLIIYSSRYGFRDALILTAAVVGVSFICSEPSSILYVVASCLLGTVYGWELSRGKSAGRLLATAVIGSFLVDAGSVLLSMKIYGVDLMAELDELTEQIRAFLASYNYSLPQNWNMPALFLFVFVLRGVLEGVVLHLLTALILRRLKLPFPQFRALDKVHMPRWIAGYTVILYFAVLYAQVQFGTDSVQTEYVFLGLAAGMFVGAYYGYIAAVVWMRRSGWGKMAWLIVLLLFLMPRFMFPALAVLGILDSFFDLKGRISGGGSLGQ